jgi:hypothetical protein
MCPSSVESSLIRCRPGRNTVEAEASGEPEEDRAYGEHVEAEAVMTAAVEPEEDRAHGEHEPEAEAEAVAAIALVVDAAAIVYVDAAAANPCREQTYRSLMLQTVKGN